MTEYLETGIDLLDRKLDGGVPTGSITAFSAAPASQAELVLYELATVRPALYLTTIRPVDDVEEVVSRFSFDDSELVVSSLPENDPVDRTLGLVEELPERSTLVIDPMEIFEHLPATKYWTFLNDLRDRLSDVQGAGFLHCLAGRNIPPRRDMTEYVADIVFRMSTERRGENLENDLTVPKYRGGRAIEDVIKLSLTTEVDVDISRNIV